MFPRQCLFCDHINPAGAKFCNDCGSSLHAKRCSQCAAINDQAAKNCSKCRTEFPVLSFSSEAPPVPSAADTTAASASLSADTIPRFDLYFHLDEPPKPPPSAAKVIAAAQAPVEPGLGTVGAPAPQLARSAAAIEIDKLDLAFNLQRPTFADPAPSVIVASDREHMPEPGSEADIQDVPQLWSGDETTETRESEPEIVTREPRFLGRAITSLFSTAQRTTAMVPSRDPDAMAEPRPRSRVALGVLLPTAALIAIGISAYYIYSHSVQVSERQAISGAPADVNASDAPTRPMPKIGVTGYAPPPASPDTGSIAAIETAKPAPPIEPPTAVTTSPASTSDQATPAQPFAPKTDEGVKGPSAAIPLDGELRRRTVQTAGNEVTAKDSARNRPMRIYPAASAAGSVQPLLGDGRASVRPVVPSPRACTTEVAALGLCSLNSKGESK